jgi:hypothetical protein
MQNGRPMRAPVFVSYFFFLSTGMFGFAGAVPLPDDGFFCVVPVWPGNGPPGRLSGMGGLLC